VSVALDIQHEMRMRPVVRPVARPAQHFSTLYHKWHYIFKKKSYWKWNVCFWLSLQLLS